MVVGRRVLRTSVARSALLVFVLAGLLTSMFTRKQEARNPYVRLVEVSEETTDPAPWGVNWPRRNAQKMAKATISTRLNTVAAIAMGMT